VSSTTPAIPAARPVHVLLNTPHLDLMGGVANFYRMLRPHLSANVDYFIVGERPGESGRLDRLRRFVRDYLDFLRQLRNGYDLVHLNPSLGSKAVIRDGMFLLLAKLLGKKVMVFMHGWDRGCEHRLRRYFMPLFRAVYFRADAFVVLCSEFKSNLIDMGYRGPVFTETTAVGDQTLAAAKGVLTKPPSAANRGFNILFLSRLERPKGVYEALQAYRLLKVRHPEATLTIAGHGSELEPLKACVRDQGLEGVIFTGYVRGADKQRVFSSAQAFCLPSYGEGMPIAVLEAMAFGLPIVTRPVGGLRDLIEEGRTGFLIEGLDPELFADRLEQLLMDPALRRCMAQHNHQYARNHFAAPQVAARIEGIYRDVASSQAASHAPRSSRGFSRRIPEG